MIYLIFGTIAASSSLTIIKDKDISFSYPAKIEAFSVVSPISILILAKAIDRFFAVFSASAKSFL
jgi:hypothetical protein